MGVLFSILAGIFITLQAVFNANVSSKIGDMETNVLVHGVGFIFAFFAMLFLGKGSFKAIGEVKPIYLFGGLIGVGIIYTVNKGITLLGATYASSIFLVSQILLSVIIDYKGLFGMERLEFNSMNIVGLVVMLLGLLIFKLA